MMDVYRRCIMCGRPVRKLVKGVCSNCPKRHEQKKRKRTTLLRMMSQADGCCCDAKFISKIMMEETKEAEARLGISRRTLNYWKSKYFYGTIDCQHSENCQDLPPPHGTLTEDK